MQTKLCSRCKEEKTLDGFYPIRKNPGQVNSECKVCHNKYCAEWRQRNREIVASYNHNWKSKNPNKINKEVRLAYRQSEYGRKATQLYSYKRDAGRRGYEFSISKEEFMSFWQKNCHYCGSFIPTIGIDRVDNKQGYVLSNCVPCCFDCNRGKGELSMADFISKAHKIARNHPNLSEKPSEYSLIGKPPAGE